MEQQIIEMGEQITQKDMLLARREEDIAKQGDQISQYSQENTSLKAEVESLRHDRPDSLDKAVQTEKEMIKDVMTNGMFACCLTKPCYSRSSLQTTSEAWMWLLVQPSTSLGADKPMCGRGMV